MGAHNLTGWLGKVKGKGEGNAMLVQAYTGSECSRRLRFQNFIKISNKI
jgi:hypothetical protein